MAFAKSMITRTGMTKMNVLAAAFAIQIARQKNDPLYAKMIKLKRAYKFVKKQLIQKYAGKGRLAARQAAMKH
jgi:hypothetical protein